MMRFFSIDLRSTRVGCRRMLAYINALPPDAATHREDTEWDDLKEMLARVLEATDYWGRVAAAMLGLKDVNKHHPPILVEHRARTRAAPDVPRRPVTTDTAKIHRFFSRMGGA